MKVETGLEFAHQVGPLLRHSPSVQLVMQLRDELHSSLYLWLKRPLLGLHQVSLELVLVDPAPDGVPSFPGQLQFFAVSFSRANRFIKSKPAPVDEWQHCPRHQGEDEHHHADH